MRRMNVNSTAQVQQLLFAPSGSFAAECDVARGRKGHEGLPRTRAFDVPNTEGIVEPGKKKPLKNRSIAITGLRIPPVSFTDTGLPQCNAATIKALAGTVDEEDPSASKWGLAYEVGATSGGDV